MDVKRGETKSEKNEIKKSKEKELEDSYGSTPDFPDVTKDRISRKHSIKSII